MECSELDSLYMLRALELAARGEGLVEPNPMVGCVIVLDGQVIGEGWHRRYGQAHAEVEALASARHHAAGATMYVTLEPCCHFGKTPPCTQAVIAAGVRRVVIAQEDPFAQVRGQGVAELERTGIEVEIGVCAAEAMALNAPYRKLIATRRPWVIAKWAMTLDGKIATASGDSKWISSGAAREMVHRIRGRVDAVVVGRGTAESDDPLLTARPAGPRVAARVVLDSNASLRLDSQLVATAREVPVLVAVGPNADQQRCEQLRAAGCDVLELQATAWRERVVQLLEELGRRRMTNVLVEGGGQVLGSLFDARQVDEVHAFVAPKISGGNDAASPVRGSGVSLMSQAIGLIEPEWQQVGSDLYMHGRVKLASSRDPQ